PDVVIGSPIANRTRVEIEDLIGFFANMLPFRVGLSGNPGPRAALRRVREVCLGAYAHQDVPFEKLVDALQPERDLSHTPIFQVMLALQNVPFEPIELEGVSFSPMPLETATSKFDLTVTLGQTESGA